VTPAVQLNRDTTDVGIYLRTNHIEATKIPQWVWYKLDTAGLGPYPVLSDSVKVLFYVWQLPTVVDPLITDTIQSSITSKSTTRKALLSTVISGMQMGLQRFPVGSYGRLYIPSGLAFGSTGSLAVPPHTQAIPPNANLLYEVKLLSTAGTRLTADTTAVSNYIGSIATSLVTSGITNIKKDPSGVWYSYGALVQSSAQPTLNSNVKVSLSCEILNSGTPFYSVSDTTFALNTTPVTALKIVLPKITVGTTVTIYVPSGYGYGSLSPPLTVNKPNSNLIYTITLNSVF
jgi:FKBP-type peptidyl-prolyl cis-trans isomerase